MASLRLSRLPLARHAVSLLHRPLSVRRVAEQEEAVFAALRTVVDPVLAGLPNAPSLVTQGRVDRVTVDEAAGHVELRLALPTGAHPKRAELEQACQQATQQALPWCQRTTVLFHTATPRHGRTTSSVLARAGVVGGDAAASTDTGPAPGLAQVGTVLAVSSCKGGVGKSTVALNLAMALARLGGRVGLLDVDIYGPSLPTLLEGVVGPEPVVRRSRDLDNHVEPVEVQLTAAAQATVPPEPLRCLSFGWVNPDANVPGAGGRDAAVVRGAVASRVVQQLLLGTAWGALDYLVLDMPPGTGDVQLTVAQHANIAGAVVVTTPAKLAHVDVVKGVQMFDKLKVPTLAVVENLAYTECSSCGTRSHPFGVPGRHLDHLATLVPSCRAVHLPLPLDPAVGAANENGVPLLHSDPEHPQAQPFLQLAEDVAASAYRSALAQAEAPVVRWHPKRGGVVVRWVERLNGNEVAREALVPAEELRWTDPVTGNPVERSHVCGASGQLHPTAIDARGNYALRLLWSDGHEHPFFTYDAVLAVAQRVGAPLLAAAGHIK